MIPEDLASEVQSDTKVILVWDKQRPSCQRRYIRFLAEAKKPETRRRRIKAVLRMTEEY
ncbi:MAG: YdeI/OmpD-associated family protein [Chloroflexi bacterium]|nr:YdeI/OmpD-associated family protein [Chloroflexota bacterium]